MLLTLYDCQVVAPSLRWKDLHRTLRNVRRFRHRVVGVPGRFKNRAVGVPGRFENGVVGVPTHGRVRDGLGFPAALLVYHHASSHHASSICTEHGISRIVLLGLPPGRFLQAHRSPVQVRRIQNLPKRIQAAQNRPTQLCVCRNRAIRKRIHRRRERCPGSRSTNGRILAKIVVFG